MGIKLKITDPIDSPIFRIGIRLMSHLVAPIAFDKFEVHRGL